MIGHIDRNLVRLYFYQVRTESMALRILCGQMVVLLGSHILFVSICDNLGSFGLIQTVRQHRRRHSMTNILAHSIVLSR